MSSIPAMACGYSGSIDSVPKIIARPIAATGSKRPVIVFVITVYTAQLSGDRIVNAAPQGFSTDRCDEPVPARITTATPLKAMTTPTTWRLTIRSPSQIAAITAANAGDVVTTSETSGGDR